MNLRALKGKDLFNKGKVKFAGTIAGRRIFEVASGKKIYRVINAKGRWTCDCPDHIYRKVVCKHIFGSMIKNVTLKKATLDAYYHSATVPNLASA